MSARQDRDLAWRDRSDVGNRHGNATVLTIADKNMKNGDLVLR